MDNLKGISYMKNVVNRALVAKKKIFLLAFVAFFSSIYTNVWGTIYTHNYSGGTNIQGSYNTETKTLTITGTGAISNCLSGNNYYSSNNTNVKTVIVSEGITGIGQYVFSSYTNLKTIKFPSTLTSISSNNFGSTLTISAIHAASPNQWAQVDIASTSAHPFGTTTSVPDTIKTRRGFFFYGNTSKSANLVFAPGLTTIKQYTFYNARYFTSASIPNSVSSIGTSALTCLFDEVAVNRTTAPTISANAVTFNQTEGKGVLYVPSGAKSNYTQANYWLYHASQSTSGAKSVTQQDTSGSCTMSSGSASWVLDANGVLTITGNGAIGTYSRSANYGWTNFRRLVHKVVIQNDGSGDITSIGDALQWNWAITEVTISQNTIPTSSVIGGNSTTFGDMFNTRDKIKLIIRKVSEEDAELSNDPWNNARWERSIITCDDFTFWYGTTKGSEDHYECLSFVEGSTDTWLSELWTIPSANQWTYVGKPNWDVANAKSANLQLSNMPYALNHANNLGTIGTNVMEGAQGYIKICSNSSDNNKYVGFIPAGYVLRWGTDENGWSSIPFVAASENIEEENWNTPLHTWTSDNAAKYTYVGLKTESDYVWSNRSETRRPIFLKPNANWMEDDAKFVMYFWDGSSHTGYSAIMTDPDGDGIYEAWIPNTHAYTNVIFGRLKPVQVDPVVNWDNKWNKTVDLTLPSDKNVFTIESGSGDAYTGSWSVYDKKGTFHISANSNTNNWYCHFLPHHVLTFDANGGEDAPEDQSVAINAAPCQLTVSSTEPTRTGYDFLGWSTNSDATSPDDAWDPGDTHAMTGDVTLYAVWSPATLTFNASEDANWNNANNWSPSSLPTINHEVIINKPATVNTTAARAKSIVINQEGGNSGQLVVDAGQKLIVAGTIQKTTDGKTYSATEANDIIINSDATHGLGALVIGTHDGTNKATVNFTTLSSGTSEDNTSIAQYVGTPFKDETNILHNWYNSWVYGITYDGSKNIDWYRVNEGEGMNPFKGYCVFSADGTGHSYWQQGTLVASENQTISGLNCQSDDGTANPNNENLLANSWVAPIKINAMASSDFTNAYATVYIFNSTSNSAYVDLGNYATYPVNSAADIAIIPSMQSFSVFTTGSGASVSLDYSKIVYDPAVGGTVPGPNKAPRLTKAETAHRMKLYVSAENGYSDMLYLLEHLDFEEGFENGWDGHKLFGESVAPQLYAVTPDGNMAVNCIPTFEGVQMGFKAGEQDNSYTFTFEYSDEAQPLYLLDISTNTYTQITSDTSYSFTTTDTDVHNRFVLTYNAPSTPTALETTPAVTTGKKVMYDNHLFILHNGRIFSAQGAMIQ
jgi:uncharacterized repeat protein (TIGR02543 family)